MNNMILMFQLNIWVIPTTDENSVMCTLQTNVLNLFLMYLNRSSVLSHAFNYYGTCTYHSIHCVISDSRITSSQTKYLGLNYVHIFLFR